jgi:hypothetical protein
MAKIMVWANLNSLRLILEKEKDRVARMNTIKKKG